MLIAIYSLMIIFRHISWKVSLLAISLLLVVTNNSSFAMPMTFCGVVLIGDGQAVFDEEIIDFTTADVVSIDESLPWKPPLRVNLHFEDDDMVENIDATRAIAVLKARDQFIELSVAAAIHIKQLHMDSLDLGSRFSHMNLKDLLEDVAFRLSDKDLDRTDSMAFSIDMERPMGEEGLISLSELVRDSLLTQAQLNTFELQWPAFRELNLSGSQTDKREFIQSFSSNHPQFPISFKLVRNGVLIPSISMPKRSTTLLFVALGPLGNNRTRPIYTMAPGRYMPKHPDPTQHMSDGQLDRSSFDDSVSAWFRTLMITQD